MTASNRQAREALAAIAKENGVTTDEVRREICKAIEEGLKSTDPNAIRFWESIPRKGDKPVPEEVIRFAYSMVFLVPPGQP